MPSITIVTSAEHHLDASSFSEFSARLAQLCMEIIQAKENNIHISYVTAEVGFGTPVYAEARLRQEEFRTLPVMEEFMRKVDLLIKEKTGVTARIRCFSFDANSVFAKN